MSSHKTGGPYDEPWPSSCLPLTLVVALPPRRRSRWWGGYGQHVQLHHQNIFALDVPYDDLASMDFPASATRAYRRPWRCRARGQEGIGAAFDSAHGGGHVLLIGNAPTSCSAAAPERPALIGAQACSAASTPNPGVAAPGTLGWRTDPRPALLARGQPVLRGPTMKCSSAAMTVSDQRLWGGDFFCVGSFQHPQDVGRCAGRPGGNAAQAGRRRGCRAGARFTMTDLVKHGGELATRYSGAVIPSSAPRRARSSDRSARPPRTWSPTCAPISPAASARA